MFKLLTCVFALISFRLWVKLRAQRSVPTEEVSLVTCAYYAEGPAGRLELEGGPESLDKLVGWAIDDGRLAVFTDEGDPNELVPAVILFLRTTLACDVPLELNLTQLEGDSGWVATIRSRPYVISAGTSSRSMPPHCWK